MIHFSVLSPDVSLSSTSTLRFVRCELRAKLLPLLVDVEVHELSKGLAEPRLSS